MKHEENTVNALFQVFWNSYGKKRERMDAGRAWQRLTDKDRQAAINGIPSYHKQCQQQGKDLPYPAAYLNQRLWQKPKGRPPKHRQKAAKTDTSADGYFYGMEIW